MKRTERGVEFTNAEQVALDIWTDRMAKGYSVAEAVAHARVKFPNLSDEFYEYLAE